MTGLTNLYVANNPNLTGTLPSAWSNMRALEKMYVWDNPNVNGTLPSEWGK